MHFWLIFLIIIIIDQGSKLLIQFLFTIGDSVIIIDKLLSFTYILNPGAALGFFAYHTSLLIIITILVILFIVFFNYRLPAYYSMMRTGLAFQLGGAVGNLIDRIRIGYVIDFIDVSFFPPIFNIADAAIFIGILYFIVSLSGEGMQPLTAKKYLPASYKKINLRFSPFGYDYKETEDYFSLIAGDMEQFRLSNKEYNTQISNLFTEISELKEDNYEKRALLKEALNNINEIKEKESQEIQKRKDNIQYLIDKLTNKKNLLKKENEKLLSEKNLILSNKEKYKSLINISEKSLKSVYHLASVLPKAAEHEVKENNKETEAMRQDALKEKEKAELIYKETLKRNEELKEELSKKRAKLDRLKSDEENLQKAFSITEKVSQNIAAQAEKEVELIKMESVEDSARIVREADEYARESFPFDEELNLQKEAELNKRKEALRKVLQKKLLELDAEYKEK